MYVEFARSLVGITPLLTKSKEVLLSFVGKLTVVGERSMFRYLCLVVSVTAVCAATILLIVAMYTIKQVYIVKHFFMSE